MFAFQGAVRQHTPWAPSSSFPRNYTQRRSIKHQVTGALNCVCEALYFISTSFLHLLVRCVLSWLLFHFRPFWLIIVFIGMLYFWIAGETHTKKEKKKSKDPTSLKEKKKWEDVDVNPKLWQSRLQSQRQAVTLAKWILICYILTSRNSTKLYVEKYLWQVSPWSSKLVLHSVPGWEWTIDVPELLCFLGWGTWAGRGCCGPLVALDQEKS